MKRQVELKDLVFPVLNLTQNNVTPLQADKGVREPNDKPLVRKLLTFTELPDRTEVDFRLSLLRRAIDLHKWADGVMIGSVPLLIPRLERIVAMCGKKPCYPFNGGLLFWPLGLPLREDLPT